MLNSEGILLHPLLSGIRQIVVYFFGQFCFDLLNLFGKCRFKCFLDCSNFSVNLRGNCFKDFLLALWILQGSSPATRALTSSLKSYWVSAIVSSSPSSTSSILADASEGLVLMDLSPSTPTGAMRMIQVFSTLGSFSVLLSVPPMLVKFPSGCQFSLQQ